MRHFEQIETYGYFWFPEEPENKQSGRLRILSPSDIKVELFGIWDDKPSKIKEILFSGSSNINRICGTVLAGERVTLLNCEFRRRSSGSEIATLTLVAQTAFIGAGFEQEELSFKEMYFFVEGLSEWLNESGIDIGDYPILNGSTIKIRNPDSIVHDLPDGITMKFEYSLGHSGLLVGRPITNVEVTQEPLISIVLDHPKDIEFFISFATKLSNFLSLAVANETQVLAVYLPGEKLPIRVYSHMLPSAEEEKSINSLDVLFTYSDVEATFVEMMSTWLERYKEDSLETALNLYFVSKSNKIQYLDTKFLYLAQGFEVLHRKTHSQSGKICKKDFDRIKKKIFASLPESCPSFVRQKISEANHLSLSERLQEMLEPFDGWFGNDEGSKKFAKQVADTRNYLTHYSSGLEQSAAMGRELIHLYEKLETLVLLRILMLIGFAKHEITSIVQSNHRLSQILNVEHLPRQV